MTDRREQVAGSRRGRLPPPDFVLAREGEESVDPVELPAERRRQRLLAERPAADFQRRLGSIASSTRGQQQGSTQ